MSRGKTSPARCLVLLRSPIERERTPFSSYHHRPRTETPKLYHRTTAAPQLPGVVFSSGEKRLLMLTAGTSTCTNKYIFQVSVAGVVYGILHRSARDEHGLSVNASTSRGSSGCHVRSQSSQQYQAIHTRSFRCRCRDRPTKKIRARRIPPIDL